ncbi:MAG TPA: ABC transporter ATP-binding protein [Candidatus Limnocylindrales bacterium]|nr:ABC transporter ATP-binding protein [Candidatus Limnocylindrales bacterium]
MSLEASIRLTLGRLDLDMEIAIDQHAVVALLGPNGAGKTTLLRAIAGLVPFRSGRVALDGQVLEDTASGQYVPTERRPIGFVFQDYLLFPHLTVLDNVAFGLRSRDAPRRAAADKALQWLDRVGLKSYARAKPSQLSGGQRQRVALARALAPDPRLLLLDEPLSALDVTTRAEVRRDLKQHLGSFQGIRLLVTHDPLEALALADRLIVMENGHLVQTGAAEEVTQHPRSQYVADLVGVNLLRGQADHGSIKLASGPVVAAAGAELGSVFAVVHPRAVAIHRNQPEGSPRNVWSGRAASIELLGARVRVRIDGEVPLVAEVTPAALKELNLVEGGEVWLSFKSTDVGVYPA